jgi:Tfp pilus assembly protein PilN
MNAPNDLSFLPDDYLENKARRRANFICGGLFLITASMITFAFVTSERSLKDIEQQHAKVDKQFSEAAKRIQQLQQMQEKQRTMAHQAELTATLLERVPRSVLLAKVTNCLPVGVSLEDLSLESHVHQADKNTSPQTAFDIKKAGQQAKPAGPEQAQAKVYDVGLKLTGLAPTDLQVAELIRNLNSDGLFKEVNLIVSDWDKDDHENNQKDKFTENYRKFQIEMTIDPKADLQTEASAAPVRTASLDTKETN